MTNINSLQTVSRRFHNFTSPSLQTTAIAACVGLTLWYILDPKDSLKKIGVVVCVALASQTHTWIPYLKRQRTLIGFGKNELLDWESSYQSFIRLKRAKNLGKPNVNYSDFTNLEREQGAQWDTGEEFRAPLEKGAANLIKQIVLGSNILEIGSNVLDNKGLSYLARLLPKDLLKNLTYSDYIPSGVKRERCKTQRTYKCIDIRNPAKNLFYSHDCLVAINVADVLSRHDLPAMANGAHQLLKNGGLAIILADRPIMTIPLFSKFSHADDFVFPWIDEASFYAKSKILKGVKVIPTAKVRKIFASRGKEYASFFDRLMQLTPAQRQFFLHTSFFVSNSLCQFLQLTTENQVESYETTASYQKDVTSAFKSHRFIKLFAGYREGTTVIDHPDPSYTRTNGMPYNTLDYDPRTGGPLLYHTIQGIALQKLQLTATFHVMIFKKREPTLEEPHS